MDNSDILTDKQRKTLKLLFGFYQDQEHTIEEIAERYEISFQAVEERLAVALRKIRYNPSTKKIVDFTNNPVLSLANLFFYKTEYARNPNQEFTFTANPSKIYHYFPRYSKEMVKMLKQDVKNWKNLQILIK